VVDQSRTTTQLPVKTSVGNTANAYLIFLYAANTGAAQTALISVNNFFTNTNGLHILAANLQVGISNTTPTNSTSSTIQQGVIFFDTNYMYFSIANNIVKRVALNTF